MAGANTYDAAFMDRGPRLKVICRSGIGYDKVDLDAVTAWVDQWGDQRGLVAFYIYAELLNEGEI